MPLALCLSAGDYLLISKAAFEWVFDDQVEAVDIIARLGLVGAVADVGQRQAEVFGGAGLHHVLEVDIALPVACLLYTSPSPRDLSTSRMPSSA